MSIFRPQLERQGLETTTSARATRRSRPLPSKILSFRFGTRLLNASSQRVLCVERCSPSREAALSRLAELSLEERLEDTETDLILAALGGGPGDCFWIARPNGELLYMSRGYESLTGRSLAVAFSPSERMEMVHPEDRERVLAARLRLASDYDVEFRIYRPGGEIRWLHARGFPLADAEGRVLRVAGVFHDLTNQRRPGLRVAIAEDEPAIRSLVARVLRRRGYDVVELDLEALPDLEGLDVLVTDVFLPATTGVELAARLGLRFPELRVIYMSGYTSQALADLGLTPAPLLLKPFAPEQLMQLLEQDYPVD